MLETSRGGYAMPIKKGVWHHALQLSMETGFKMYMVVAKSRAWYRSVEIPLGK